MAQLEMQRRRRRKWRWVWLLAPALSIALLVTGITMGIQTKRENDMMEARGHVDDHVVNLSFVGDICIDDALMEDALQSDGTYDFLPNFLEVASRLYSADLTIGNLELNFAGEPYGSAFYSAPACLAGTLRTLGFDILQTSNSKSIAGGISGLETTIHTVLDNDMEALGTWVSKADRENNRVLVKEVNGIKIAFIALTKGFDGMSLPTGREYVADVLYKDYDTMYENVNKEMIKSALEAAKATEPDLIIAMVHWGSSYRLETSATQREILKLLVNGGADAIIGTHSHVVGEMGFQTLNEGSANERKVFIAYSLGNFISSDSTAYTRDGVILNMMISKDDLTGKTIIKAVEYTPTYIYDYGEKVNDRYKVLDLYEAMNEYKNTTSFYKVSELGFGKLQSALTDLENNSKSEYQEPLPAYLQPQD